MAFRLPASNLFVLDVRSGMDTNHLPECRMANDNQSETLVPAIERWLVTARWKDKVDGKEVWRTGQWTESRGDIETIERILGRDGADFRI